MLASFMDASSVAWDTTNIATLCTLRCRQEGHPLHQCDVRRGVDGTILGRTEAPNLTRRTVS